MSDDKLDIIQTTVNKISTDIAVLVNEMQTMNNRGCKASMDEIAELKEKRIEPMERDINNTKGMAIGGGIIGTIIATAISIWSSLRGH